MYQVTNRIHVAAGWEEAFEARFRERARRIESNPGFVRMNVLRPQAQGLPYLVQTVWRDEAAFNDWLASDDFRQAHAEPLPAEAFAGESALERHSVVVSAGSDAAGEESGSL